MSRQSSVDPSATLAAFDGRWGRGQADAIAVDRGRAGREVGPSNLPECPFCEAHPPDRTAHIVRCHPDRIRAAQAYQRVIAAGGSITEAQTAYNQTVVGRRPGTYDRTRFRRAS